MDSSVIHDVDGHLITPDTVLAAYRLRCFPMAETRGGPIAWYRPTRRAVITWDRFTVPRSLAKTLRKQPFRITVDRCFAEVIAACAQRDQTWISHDVEALYVELHRQGHAHSVEAWDADGALAGGLYGLAIGGSCVVELVGLLRAKGFALLDCQQQTPHMQRFGAREITDRAFAQLLAQAGTPAAL